MKNFGSMVVSIIAYTISVITNGCLEDSIATFKDVEYDNSAFLLAEMEERGNFINSPEFPAIKKAEEVYNNFSEYLILDVRPDYSYNNGHIKDAVNLKNTEIFNYISNLGNTDKKILIVSYAGQSSSYYTSLLRLYGFKNIFSLNFGMASWHKDFSKMLTQRIISNTYTDYFNNQPNPKLEMTFLPNVDNILNLTAPELLKEKINNCFNEGFDESINGFTSGYATIDYYYLMDVFNNRFTSNYNIICYSFVDLYFYGRTGDISSPGHLRGAILYQPYPLSHLSSSNFLQTLPNDKEIFVYSYSGQYSAMAVAYLKILGYDAKTLLYGMHGMSYERLLEVPTLEQYAYKLEDVKDYPYEK